MNYFKKNYWSIKKIWTKILNHLILNKNTGFKINKKIYIKNIKNIDINIVIKLLKNNNIIVYPADTCYGIMGLFNSKNIEKINEIKKRNIKYKIPVLISDIDEINFISNKEKEIIMSHINLNKKKPAISYVISQEKPAIRIIKNNDFFLVNIIKKTGPLLASSFNLTKFKTCKSLIDFENFPATNISALFYFTDYISNKPSKIYNINLKKYIR